MSREKQIECASCLHYNACLINSEYVPSPCRAYENNAGYRKQVGNANFATTTGEWIDRHNGNFVNPIYMCSVCGKGTLLKPHINELDNMEMIQALSPFCPNCGAKMKGGAK